MKGACRKELPLKSPNSPVSSSRIQSRAWAIRFLVLHGPALAKMKSSLHSSSSHQRWGDQSEPLHVKEKINQCTKWKKLHVTKSQSHTLIHSFSRFLELLLSTAVKSMKPPTLMGEKNNKERKK